jgi:hypothetical protein
MALGGYRFAPSYHFIEYHFSPCGAKNDTQVWIITVRRDVFVFCIVFFTRRGEKYDTSNKSRAGRKS